GQYVTVWDAIGDLPELEPGQSKEEYSYPAITDYQRKMRRGSSGLQGHFASKHPEHLVNAISHIPDGGNRKSIPKRFQPASGYHNSYSRLHSKSPAVAVTQNMGKPSGTRCIHPFQNRGLTAREGARLQGFPDTFHFCGGMMSQRLQIANAVSPILARVLGRALADERSWSEPARRPRAMRVATLPFTG
ncbi:MAG: DNA cytosine methyltransferase, partial [Planctomycetaceae bacterium]|nr:DNA cytosine methyltransferase [Planctomycetaceae bacterium]